VPAIRGLKPRGPRSPTNASLQNVINSDRTSPIAALGPCGFFMTDRGPRASDVGSGKVAGKVWTVDRGARSAKLLL
jgi:hypothetical protein